MAMVHQIYIMMLHRLPYNILYISPYTYKLYGKRDFK